MMMGLLGAVGVGGGGGGGGDPSFSSVKLLLGFEGANASTGSPGMTDESSAAHGTASVFGSAQISTAQSKFGASSLLLNGTTDDIRWPDSADWDLAAGQFTIECSIRPASVSGSRIIVGQWFSTPNLAWILHQSGTTLTWRVSTSGANEFTDLNWTGLTTGTWFDVAVDYDGTKNRLYVNGSMVSSSTTARTIFNNAGENLAIGSNTNGTDFFFSGHIDELRITKGVARYASDGGYTPAVAAFPRS